MGIFLNFIFNYHKIFHILSFCSGKIWIILVSKYWNYKSRTN